MLSRYFQYCVADWRELSNLTKSGWRLQHVLNKPHNGTEFEFGTERGCVVLEADVLLACAHWQFPLLQQFAALCLAPLRCYKAKRKAEKEAQLWAAIAPNLRRKSEGM